MLSSATDGSKEALVLPYRYHTHVHSSWGEGRIRFGMRAILKRTHIRFYRHRAFLGGFDCISSKERHLAQRTPQQHTMAEEYFDPRKHSAVTMRITEKVAGDFAGTQEESVKTYYVGPQKRPGTAPASRKDSAAMAPGPEYLNKDGTWSAKAPSNKVQQQQLSMTQTLATLPGGRAVAPVAAVHSYADNSPLVTSDYTHELPLDYTRRPQTATMMGQTFGNETFGGGGSGPTEVWMQATMTESQRERERPSSAGPRVPEKQGAFGSTTTKRTSTMDLAQTKKQPYNTVGHAGVKLGVTGAWESMDNSSVEPHNPTAAYTTKSPRKNVYYDGLQHHVTPVEHGTMTRTMLSKATAPPSYLIKQNGTTTMWKPPKLTIQDMNRENSLGKSVSPCSPQAKLVGGQWRYIPRHTDGDTVYTDYYGRYGADANNYYGRGYTVNPNEHTANRVLSENIPYDRVRASIPGIETLRNKPGLSLKSTIVNGPTHLLPEPDAQLHKISDTFRMAPATERSMRAEGKIP